MPDLRVPARYRSALQAIARLENETADGLIAAVEAEEPYVGTERLVSVADSSVADFDSRDAEDVIDALFSLASQIRYRRLSVPEFMQRIARSPDLELDSDERERLGQRLTRLMCSPVRSTAKAVDLGTDAEHVLMAARSLTDLRPVYDDDREVGEPSGAVVITTLRLDHWTDGEPQSIYIALDAEDLEELADELVRAQRKASQMREFAAQAGIAVFEQERDHADD